MKREDLEKLGLTKEQIDSVCDLNNKDMKPVKDDLQKAQDDLKVAQEKLTTAEEAVKKFDGVDLEKQNQQIKDLQDALKKKEEEHAAELAARDFNSLLEKSISSVKGKNSKAIMALLDMDSLRSSKPERGCRKGTESSGRSGRQQNAVRGAGNETYGNPEYNRGSDKIYRNSKRNFG